MGSNLVKKQVKGKSTPAQAVGGQDDADEYAEDEFEVVNNEEHQPTPK